MLIDAVAAARPSVLLTQETEWPQGFYIPQLFVVINYSNHEPWATVGFCLFLECFGNIRNAMHMVHEVATVSQQYMRQGRIDVALGDEHDSFSHFPGRS